VPNPDLIARTASAVLEYLTTNPQAKDTAAGIQAWWLAGEVDMRSLQAALDLLVASNQVRVDRAREGISVYGRMERRQP
jgi:hypothetical protein